MLAQPCTVLGRAKCHGCTALSFQCVLCRFCASIAHPTGELRHQDASAIRSTKKNHSRNFSKSSCRTEVAARNHGFTCADCRAEKGAEAAGRSSFRRAPLQNGGTSASRGRTITRADARSGRLDGLDALPSASWSRPSMYPSRKR